MIPDHFPTALKERIALVNAGAPGSIGELMDFRVTDWDDARQEVTMTCRTFDWMRNYAGTLHGGMCATIVDQAMGFVSNALKGGHGVVPTVQLSVNYHRPLIPGEMAVVKVRVVSETRTLMTLESQAALSSHPEKICLSATGLYFYKAES